MKFGDAIRRTDTSERGDRLAKAFFPTVAAHAGSKPFPMRWLVSPKSANRSAPGLEVADFIVQAAGAQVRNHEAGKRNYRKDFVCIFQSVDDALVEFAELDSIAIARNPGGTIPGILINTPDEIIKRPTSK